MTGFESSSEIARRAEKLVMDQLRVKPTQERVIARECLSPRTEADTIAVHEYAAELYEELIAAAPGIFNGRDALIADAKGVADDGQ